MVDTVRSNAASRRFAGLAASRAVAQVLSLVWFLVSARMLSPASFGEIATALGFFAVFAGLGDAGTTRTVVRYVAADQRCLRPAYRTACSLRVTAGLLVGTVTALGVWVAPVGIDPFVIFLSGIAATASGVTELAYAGLRSLNVALFESTSLIAERVLFLAGGTTAIAVGGKAASVMAVYVIVNFVTAVAGTIAIRANEPATETAPGPFTDREARLTACGFALVTVAPRVPLMVVSLTSSAVAVGSFALANRPVEALALFSLSAAAPAMPMVRAHTAAGSSERAIAITCATALTLCALMAAPIALLIGNPSFVTDLLSGDTNFPDVELVLTVVAVVAPLWVIRGVAEFLLLAENRAGVVLKSTIAGLLVALGVGVALTIPYGALGAAIAAVSAEVVMALIVFVSRPGLAAALASPQLGAVVGIAALAATTMRLTGTLPATIAIGVAALIPTTAIAVRSMRRIDSHDA